MKLQLHDWRVKKLQEDTLIVIPRPKSKRELNKLHKYAERLKKNNTPSVYFYLNGTSLNNIQFGIKIYWMLFGEKTKEISPGQFSPLLGNIDLFKK